MGVMKRKSLMIIEFSDHMFIHLVQIHFWPLSCCYYVTKKEISNIYIACYECVFFSLNSKKKKNRCSRIQISFHILVADGRCAKLSTAGVYCAVHSQNPKNFLQSKFLCLSLLLNHTFSWQELNMIRVDVVQICGIWGKL